MPMPTGSANNFTLNFLCLQSLSCMWISLLYLQRLEWNLQRTEPKSEVILHFRLMSPSSILHIDFVNLKVPNDIESKQLSGFMVLKPIRSRQLGSCKKVNDRKLSHVLVLWKTSSKSNKGKLTVWHCWYSVYNMYKLSFDVQTPSQKKGHLSEIELKSNKVFT